ncbi:flavohemoglobin [Heterostelium album PN500]|uniref:nitric oxide dioxygenase n=1 Tax=Heterostelium pallidum (strain ATCC 26659 / Pp 5 / PN500) TaxID=670386 RepID=D3B1S6_HETP5|nr:flavohemoglobin [Heterostelium album PN500]EFA85250.1 flavohemoglobin [Heterostelium album PN500]|eukprot:XP_020437359.1 flavohemoglobin [Heterostelium album PN500]
MVELDAKTIEIVKSTIPALAGTGSKLTQHFYARMLGNNPELKNVFNEANQRSNAQSEALFGAVCAYAQNIDNLAPLLPAVEKIAQKHCSLNIKPEQYSIVGENLLATIDELLAPPKEVIDAWAAAYGVLADIFIQREKEIYDQSASVEGGWRGLREFKITEIVPQSNVISSFKLEPVDAKPVAKYEPGQYLSIHIEHPSLKNQCIRQYSLTTEPNGQYYRIAVKREELGSVSSLLHNTFKVGDTINVYPPHGDFFFNSTKDLDTNTPVTLISGGVGQTPMLSMLHGLKENGHQGKVTWLHSARDAQSLAFEKEVVETGSTLPGFSSHTFLTKPSPSSGCPFATKIHEGIMDIQKVLANQLKDTNVHYYFCGPVPFMQAVAKQLTENGVAVSNIHYEVFGPHRVI